MSLSCPTNYSAAENFLIHFDDENPDAAISKKAQLALVEYLQEFRLLRSFDCPKYSNHMELKFKNKNLVPHIFWRCGKFGCQTVTSVRDGSEFFNFIENKNRLSLFKIVKQLEYFLKGYLYL